MDLSTTYLGLRLKNPLVVSASPLSADIGNIRQMEEAGAAAVVLPSLFEEQLALESRDLVQVQSGAMDYFAEAITYFPDMTDYNLGPEEYIELIRRVKEAVKIPIIGSLNGSSPEGWVRYAEQIEEAGADALELNIYYIPTAPDFPGVRLEETYCELVHLVKSKVRIPVAVKLGPYFSALANLAQRLVEAGAGALVLFNRFYQPDIDLDTLEVKPRLTLSTPEELLLRLHWVGILHRHLRADLAVTGGVHSGLDVLKAMLAGAKVTMLTSALFKNGIGHLADVLREVQEWMGVHGYTSISHMLGSLSRRAVSEPNVRDRANYMNVLRSYAVRLPPRSADLT